MYQAEIHGKIPSALWSAEDLLTGLVFSLFYYSDRHRFLAPWLRTLSLEVTDLEAKGARFRFWPKFDDGTEPDLLVEVGRYLLLIEAKLLSDFGVDAEQSEKNQLQRELRGGRKEALNLGRELRLMTVTAEPFPRSRRYDELTADDRAIWIPTNWQSITLWLDRLPPEGHTDMSRDLLAALRRRGLRRFSGYELLAAPPLPVAPAPSLFFRPSFGNTFFASAQFRLMRNIAPSTPLFTNLPASHFIQRRVP